MIRWGIIGLGNIAVRFAKSLEKSHDGYLYAVASRSLEKSKNFSEEYNCKKFYGSYEQLLDDENIDVVYIALPHGLHKDWSIKALSKKKAVLCEKPVTLNKEEMIEVKKVAVENNTFFMEAMKTRFLPAIEELKSYLNNKVIGEIKSIEANFCDRAEVKETSYLFDKTMGGAILDVGIYPLSFVMDIHPREIKEVRTMKNINEKGVDTSFISIITFKDGVEAFLEGSFTYTKERLAIIKGTLGEIVVPMCNRPNNFIVNIKGEVANIEKPYKEDDFYSQIQEVNRCLKEGLLESPKMTLDESIRVMEVLDKIKNQ